MFENYDEFIKYKDRFLKDYPSLYSYEHRYKQFLDCDFLFISYPKSGRTWVRYFLGRYIEYAFNTEFSMELPSLHEKDKKGSELNLPLIAITHNYFDFFQDVRGEPFILDLNESNNKDYILLVRDPRDVTISYFHHKVTRKNLNLQQMNINEFFLSNIYGIERHSKWVLQLLKFYKDHRSPKILLIYELLKKNPKEFRKLIHFIYKDVKEDALSYAVKSSEFRAMQTYEINQNTNAKSQGRLALANWDGNYNALKVRRGKVEGYKKELSIEFIKELNNFPYTKILIEELEGLNNCT